MISVPSPQAPPPPPNPPLFGAMNTAGSAKRQRQLAQGGEGFGATILGQGNPTNTGNRTLLGQ